MSPKEFRESKPMPGFYWVKPDPGGPWEPAEWQGPKLGWRLLGTSFPALPDDAQVSSLVDADSPLGTQMNLGGAEMTAEITTGELVALGDGLPFHRAGCKRFGSGTAADCNCDRGLTPWPRPDQPPQSDALQMIIEALKAILVYRVVGEDLPPAAARELLERLKAIRALRCRLSAATNDLPRLL